MKKRNFLLAISLLGMSVIANAQQKQTDQTFRKGDNVVAVGIGLGSSILNYSGSS